MADAMTQGGEAGSPGSPASSPFGVSGGDMQRAKVYKLNDAGLWDDRGTGHVTVEYMEVRFTAGITYRIASK